MNRTYLPYLLRMLFVTCALLATSVGIDMYQNAKQRDQLERLEGKVEALEQVVGNLGNKGE